MQAYHIEEFGSVDGLVIRDHEIPQPDSQEVLVQIRAVSLNRRDLYILKRTYPVPPRPGVIPISDGVGEIVAVGAEVSRFKVGDRVAGNYFVDWKDGQLNWEFGSHQLGCTIDGMLAEYALLHQDWLVSVPAHLSWEEAATLPCAALVAWSSLTGPKALIPGDTVLTLGTGGVALFALQFAKLFGARVIATTSSDEKGQRLKELGADYVINYRTTLDWERVVRELTGDRGVEHVVETGGADTLQQSIRSTAFNGEIALVSFMGVKKSMIEIDPRILARSLVTMRQVFVGSRLGFETMNRAIEQHKLRPVIDRVFAFSKAKDAYQYFMESNHFGKVVISGT